MHIFPIYLQHLMLEPIGCALMKLRIRVRKLRLDFDSERTTSQRSRESVQVTY